MKNKTLLLLVFSFIVSSFSLSVFAENPEKGECMRPMHHPGHKEMREKMKDMTEEERKQFREAHKAEKMKNMTAEEKEKFKSRSEKHKAHREKMKGMSPSQRKAYMEGLRDGKMANMSDEEREAFKKRHELRKKECAKK